jgi:hypothetical protein
MPDLLLVSVFSEIRHKAIFHLRKAPYAFDLFIHFGSLLSLVAQTACR